MPHRYSLKRDDQLQDSQIYIKEYHVDENKGIFFQAQTQEMLVCTTPKRVNAHIPVLHHFFSEKCY